jgi:hypothetical protein
MSTYRITLLAAAASLALAGGFASPAFAAKTKNCGSTPVNGGLTSFETQTAACGSASDTGEQITVKNKAGKTPPGAQPN